VNTNLDASSRAIIAQLQEDGRRAYSTIAKAVGLSEAAVRGRVKTLTESGVLQVVAVTDPMQVGFARQAMVAISINGNVEEAAEHLARIDEIDYLVITAGSYDILAEVVVAGDDHLLELINERIRAVPGVVRTETFLYLKLTKQTYNWGVK
jgi:Lrp/AsnC family transcriptional regulator for asnA, asnC and gidA